MWLRGGYGDPPRKRAGTRPSERHAAAPAARRSSERRPSIDAQRSEPVGASAPVRHLSLADATAVVVGIVVGAGIFRSPALVAMNTSGPAAMVAAWVLGGLLCLCGALAYTELAAAYPAVGGEYVYLTRAFGRGVGFLFVWARTTVIQTGSIAALAYIFGDYVARLIPSGPAGPMLWALAAAVILTACNVLGLRTGRWTQNLLTAAKVVGVCAIAAAGLLCAGPAAVEPEAAAGAAAVADGTAGSGPGAAAFGLAMVFVLYTFGGWNEAAYVAGELRNPRRNTLRLLVGSILLLTVLHVAINLAYLRVLGFEGVRGSSAVAADAMSRLLGRGGSAAVVCLVAVSALGAMNGCIFTGARAVCALGGDFAVLGPLGRWHGRLGTPAAAILLQSSVAVVLILLPGLGEGFRKALGSGFEAAVEYTAPVFWAFLLMTGAAVFVLRVRDPGAERPFRVPLAPLTVGLFCLMCGWMLYSSLAYTRAGALVGVGVLAVGAVAYLALGRRPTGPA
ncbi:MAG: amino acid permease [Planctomycetes bacterium]|nr:amino acid permease [Planctomycetota bacterium]